MVHDNVRTKFILYPSFLHWSLVFRVRIFSLVNNLRKGSVALIADSQVPEIKPTIDNEIFK